MNRLTTLIIVGVAAPVMFAQDARPEDAPAKPDPVLLLNRAMMLYDIGDYKASEACLSQLLDASPEDATARFLRALALGQQAVPHDLAARRLEAQEAVLEAERKQAASQPTAEQQTKIDGLASRVQQVQMERQAELKAARELYSRMREDLDSLLGKQLRDREAMLRLLDAVANVKLARLTINPADQAAERDQKAKFLDHARRVLEEYVRMSDQEGQLGISLLNRVRGRFFLGVVLYRRATLQTDAAVPTVLEDARRVLSEMVEPGLANVETILSKGTPEEREQVPDWLSYPYFYLGLTRVQMASVEKTYAQSRERLMQAKKDLQQARLYDVDQSGRSRSSMIRDRVDALNQKIDSALELKEAEPLEDFRIDWQMGLAYDTNVPLLGGNTAAPRDIGDPKDFRFETGIGLGYTLDLAKADKQFDGWTLGLGGRASGGWHCDISSYNPQDYGGSVALQYEAVKARSVGDYEQGPLYATIQYDYDYFLLGNKGFLRNNRVTPRLTLYTFNQRSVTTLGFRYEDRNYFEDLYNKRFNRDGNYFAFLLNESYDLLDMTAQYGKLGWQPWGLANDPKDGEADYQRWLRPYIGSEYGWDATAGSEWDNKYILLGAGIDVPLPYGLMLDFRAEWEWENYAGTRGGSLVDFHRRGREDFIQSYSLGLERSFVLEPGKSVNRRTREVDRLVLTVRTNVSWTNDDSNVKDRLGQNVYSYDRAIYGLGFTLTWD